MINRVAADMAVRPDLFRWRSAIPSHDLRAWVRETGLSAFPGFISLWSVTGGGELFETEELLDPLDDRDFGVAPRTKDLREVIPAGSTVSHEGIWLTVITTDGQIVAVDRRSGRTRRRYPSLDDWYQPGRPADQAALPCVKADLGALGVDRWCEVYSVDRSAFGAD